MTSIPSRYRVIRALGAGGMGEVFLAEDTVLSRELALKVLPASVHGDTARRSRFMHEARAAARLNHPNICTVFDVGESDESIFITMEYIEGVTIEQHAGGRQLPLADLLDIAMQVAEAMHEAHTKGIVHRDLKPSNLMMTPHGQIKVVDFGVAKMETLASFNAGSATVLETAPGLVVGTLTYMSPEQLRARDVDRRSDIFSFGTILYELTTGQHPFAGGATTEAIDRILNRQPPPLDRSVVPQEWERVIRKCLQKEAEDRYQSMLDLLVDLRALRRELRGESTPGKDAVPETAGKLPLQLTRFVGREDELEQLDELLAQHRLVTITGPGGVGKTRLALEAAGKRQSRLPHGAWFVDLSRVTDPALVAKSIADVLGVREEHEKPILESLSAHLQTRQVLLVIDNCEHLLDEAARVVEGLLREAPAAAILATSREALNVPGESTWSVPSLAAPPSGIALDREHAESFDAVRLFVERARASQPRFALNESNAEVIGEICRRLDGIPLAIELAAPRVRALSVDEIRARLDDTFHLLVGGSRTNPPRQQTMRAAIDWSYELLTPEERVLFGRLTCFGAGFDLPAVENVCAGDDVPDVFNTLTRLVEKSLVAADAGDDAAARYRLLAALHDYAREKAVASGEVDVLGRRHFDYYCAMAETAYGQRLESAHVWVERLEREHDNMRAALKWAADHDAEGELQLAGALAWFWQFHAHHTEARTRLRAALAAPHERTRELARALWGASALALWQGDAETARHSAEESVAIWRELGDRKEVGLALEATGFGFFVRGETAGAMAAFEESARLFAEVGDERLLNRATLNICSIHISDGNAAAARPLAERALATARQQHDVRNTHAAYHAARSTVRPDISMRLVIARSPCRPHFP